MVEKELIELLICPNCKGDIEYREDDDVIACVGKCRFEYPVVNDIPHMLVEEAKRPDDRSA
jgi:uncharacterized protein YbaR (Trm112 family)